MRILFMGTPDFAAESLKRLYEDGHDVCGVFTQPDKPKNRGMKAVFSPVKTLALAHDTPVFQPVKMRDGSAAAIVNSLNPELIVVVAYGRILPVEILNIPKFGCINIHGSILPKYRGSAPIQWAVLNGDKITGVTAMYMAEECDAGDIISVRETPIGEEETAGELFDRLMVIGADLLSETIASIADGTVKRIPQDGSLATMAPMLSRDLSPMDFSKTAAELHAQVRGLNPWPCATCQINDLTFKVFKVAEIATDDAAEPGTVISAGKNGIDIACKDGAVRILELQAPGGKRMSAADYLRGHPICL